MFLKRSHAVESVLPSEPPAPDSSVRRQGAAETLNLIGRSVAEAASGARQEVVAGHPDNFVAGQLMALGHVMSCIERERDLLQQQLINEAGLHASAGVRQWEEEMRLLAGLPVTSEELFRSAMDYRKVEEPAAEEEEAEDCPAPTEVCLAEGGEARESQTAPVEVATA